MQINGDEPQMAEQRFFASLRQANVEDLAAVLTEDFVLIEVMRGSEVSRAVLLDAIASHKIRFDEIDIVESRVRRYGSTAVIVGRTQMHGRAGDIAWTVSSRYTHVFVEQGGRWRLASAQG